MGDVTGGLVGRGVARFEENQDAMGDDEQIQDANGIKEKMRRIIG